MWRSMMVLALLPLSGAALAEDFDYSFVEASYGQLEFDEIDGDGIGVGGSMAVSDTFHVFAGYQAGNLDFDVDLNRLEAGLGFNTPLSETVDVVASVSYVSIEAETPFGSADDNGYGLGVGLRSMVSPGIEVSGGISYKDYGEIVDAQTEFGAGFLYHFSDAFAVGLSGEWGDDFNTYALNGRFSFGE